MKKLQDSFTIRQTKIGNRVCIPPLVIMTNSDEEGFAAPAAVAHYTALARGGAGLVIQEATCVSPEGKLRAHQIGLWRDEHIPGNRAIAEAVHQLGTPIFMQIHHAGVVAMSDTLLCPSAYSAQVDGKLKQGRAMTGKEIEATQEHFIQAGIRAWKAGYDGVELHGCHSYLLCQFFNSRINHREDQYRDAMNFVGPIIQGIRQGTDSRFVIGIRLGCFEPTLKEGIAHAVALEKAGVDFIDVSGGFAGESDPIKPEAFPYHEFVYGAGEIKKAVNVPVFAVNSICTPEQAQGALEATNVDMVDIGRSALVDSDWPRKALAGEKPGKCLHCAVCQWRIDPQKCAGRRLMERERREKEKE